MIILIDLEKLFDKIEPPTVIKGKVKLKAAQACPTLRTHGLHGILQVRILEWVSFPSPGDLPNLGIEARAPALQADSLPAEP